jgi:hypothetical protein
MLDAPVISEKATYQEPESGEGRRQPRPEGSSDAETARLIAAVRIAVAGIRHDSNAFLIDERRC